MLSLLPYPSSCRELNMRFRKKWNEKEQSNNQLLIRKLVFCHDKINLRGKFCWDRIFKFLLSIPHLKLQQQCLKDWASRALPEFAEICLLHTPINSECFLLNDMRLWHRGCNRKGERWHKKEGTEINRGFLGDSDGKESTCSADDLGLIPGREKPLEKGMTPTPVFLPREIHEQRSLAAYSPWGHKESDTTERLTLTHWDKQIDVCSGSISGLDLSWHQGGPAFPDYL